jgi:hypothetical protein
MKKVILIIVDACASRVVIPAMRQGRLPNFSTLAEMGTLRPESIAIFPSITPAATASIVTGLYPNGHNVMGFHWYDLENDEVAYYGDDFWVIWREGFKEFFDDFLYKLNHQRLQADTLHQLIERANLKAANLNYLVFRGDVEHKADIPWLLRLFPGVQSSVKVLGPSILYLGDLVDTEIEVIGDTLDREGGLFHRFGFDDSNTANLLLELARDGAMPDFTLAYFPDNDYRSHEVGPEAAVTALEEVDGKLGELFEIFGGAEQMLQDFCILLTGDHSQSGMLSDEQEAGIRLDELLADFSLLKAGEHWDREEQLVLCPDMRCAQIYFRDKLSPLRERVTRQLLSDPRIDQVFWRADVFGEGPKSYCVATRDRGSLQFWPDTDGSAMATDWYGCRWNWRGELEAVDGQVSADKVITFGDYPNAFERIVGALDAKNGGHLWATATPGCEFSLAETSIHLGGGSHGSLHVLDSLSPLFIAGAPDHVKLPDHPRTVDITPLCLDILDLSSEYAVEESRVTIGEPE